MAASGLFSSPTASAGLTGLLKALGSGQPLPAGMSAAPSTGGLGGIVANAATSPSSVGLPADPAAAAAPPPTSLGGVIANAATTGSAVGLPSSVTAPAVGAAGGPPAGAVPSPQQGPSLSQLLQHPQMQAFLYYYLKSKGMIG